MTQPAKLILPARIVCSFCDNDQDHVAHIITGKPGIAICDQCVAICVTQIVADSRARRGLPTKGGQGQ